MFHGHLDYFQKPFLGGRPTLKLGDHGIPNVHNHWFVLFDHVWGPAWIDMHWNSIWLRARSHMTSHCTWGSVTTLLHDLEVSWDNLWTLSFGLSQLHGHGSWLVCEVALSTITLRLGCVLWNYVLHYHTLVLVLGFSINEEHSCCVLCEHFDKQLLIIKVFKCNLFFFIGKKTIM